MDIEFEKSEFQSFKISGNSKTIVNLLYCDSFDHCQVKKQVRIVGEQREALGLRLKSDGILNTYNTIKMSSIVEKKTNSIRVNTLHKIKNELDNRFRLSRDLIFDLRATKMKI
ncbi:hypothetical protein BpHYR1_012965 [Brachionus plicatilis]|uniref:Uncharacterized protein n=1 Tax=Brachionus plicatilis TaxID=10195 RepID=A0A3M7RBM3_BRAPC|nr:hypothetical protein BpHYR1_012965 [Brachionus plicatilis]